MDTTTKGRARGPCAGEPNPGAAASLCARMFDISRNKIVACFANQDRPLGRTSSAFLSDFRISHMNGARRMGAICYLRGLRMIGDRGPSLGRIAKWAAGIAPACRETEGPVCTIPHAKSARFWLETGWEAASIR